MALESIGVFWNIVECVGTLWNVVEGMGKCKNVLKCVETFCNVVENVWKRFEMLWERFGKLWNVLERDGKRWNVVGSVETFSHTPPILQLSAIFHNIPTDSTTIQLISHHINSFHHNSLISNSIHHFLPLVLFIQKLRNF